MRCRNKNFYGCKKIFKRNPIKRPITDAGVRINRPKDSSLRLYQEKESKKDKLSNIGKVWKQKKKLMKTMTNLMEEKDSKFLLDFYQPIKFKGFHVTLTSTMAFKNWQVIKCRLMACMRQNLNAIAENCTWIFWKNEQNYTAWHKIFGKLLTSLFLASVGLICAKSANLTRYLRR